VDLSAEREASRARSSTATHGRIARAVLERIGWGATPEAIRSEVEERWPTADPAGVEQEARRLRAAGQRGNHHRLDPEEIEIVAQTKTQATSEGIRRLLTAHPGLATRTMYERLSAEKVDLTAYSSFVNLCSRVRKELGIDGRTADGKRRRKKRSGKREEQRLPMARGKAPAMDDSPSRNAESEAPAPPPAEDVENPDQDLHTPDAAEGTARNGGQRRRTSFEAHEFEDGTWSVRGHGTLEQLRALLGAVEA
jgi:hypothetical protein